MKMIEGTMTLSRVLIFESLIRACFPFMYFVLSGDAALLWQIKLPAIAKLMNSHLTENRAFIFMF